MFTRPTTLLLICLALLAPAAARADASLVVVGFDDLPPLTLVPTHYGGIIWDMGTGGFMGRDGHATVKSAADGAAIKSPPNAMVNEWGVTRIVIRFEAGVVDFHGAFFAKDTAFLQQAAPFVGFVGFRTEDDPVPYLAAMANSEKLANLAVDFRGVVKVQITAAAGPSPLGGGYYNMDDLSYTPLIPEPTSLVALGGAMASLALRRRLTRTV